MTVEPWWERHPAEFAREEAALRDLGWAWQVDAEAKRAGKLIVRVEIPLATGRQQVRAEFPDTYPYFQPHVFAELGTFARHQNPLEGSLCLLAREGSEWAPGHDTLASLLQLQLQHIEKVNQPTTQAEEVATLEDHAAEPLSIFLRYEPGAVVLAPDETPPTDVPFGRLDLLQLQTGPIPGNNAPLRALLQSVTDASGQRLVSFEVDLPNRRDFVEGYWLRLPERPKVSSLEDLPAELLRKAEAAIAAFAKALRKAQKNKLFIVGFVYPDEVSWRATRDDWLFVALQITVGQKKSRNAQGKHALIRTDWAGRKALTRRAPFLSPLANKSVLVVGLGALGSPLTLQLARAGVGELHLLDSDYLQVGNTVRWAMGWEYAGLDKASALAWRLGLDHPYTKVLRYGCRIGQHRGDHDLVQQLVNKVDLVIDATAAHRVSHYLADQCWHLRKPYLWLTTTPGSAGGVVGRGLPGSTNCWHCFQRAMTDGRIRLPQDGGTSDVQPGGCSQPTYIGAGLDSDEVSLQASRLAVATLCRGAPDAYPDFAWNGAVVDLIRNGSLVAPEWTTYTWAAHPDCSNCQQQ